MRPVIHRHPKSPYRNYSTGSEDRVEYNIRGKWFFLLLAKRHSRSYFTGTVAMRSGPLRRYFSPDCIITDFSRSGNRITRKSFIIDTRFITLTNNNPE